MSYELRVMSPELESSKLEARRLEGYESRKRNQYGSNYACTFN